MVRRVVTVRKTNNEAEKENPPVLSVQAGFRRFCGPSDKRIGGPPAPRFSERRAVRAGRPGYVQALVRTFRRAGRYCTVFCGRRQGGSAGRGVEGFRIGAERQPACIGTIRFRPAARILLR